ncbi:MAG: arylesterase [Alphaproteobacteria bacterium]|nr:arylesterase [Alphaproteobacteria bacterium]
MVAAIRHTILFVVLIICTVSPTQALATSKILIFGDSLSSGYRLKAHEALPAVVEHQLLEMGHDIKVINGGVTGETTTGGASRLKWSLDKYQPDIVMIALGGNDMLRGISPKVVRKNIDAMLAMLQERGIKTILMAVKVPPHHDPTYTHDFNSIFPNLAERYGVALYPFFLEAIYAHKDYMLNDGIHPNAQGVKYIAGYLAGYLADTGWL